MSKTPLAWQNLRHNRIRTLVAIAGVAFALILIFMQLGFLHTVSSTATVAYDAMEFDICIRSVDYLHFVESRSFPRQRLQVAQGVPGVADVVPFYIAIRPWRTPEGQVPKRLGILTMAFPRGERVFRDPTIQREADRHLNVPNVLLIDQESRSEFGPVDGREFSGKDVGARAEVGHRSFWINGTFRMGTGLSANGAVLMNVSGFERATVPRPIQNVSLGLVQLGPNMDGQQIEAIRDELASRLPSDVEVLTRRQVIKRERDRWVKQTSFGLIFQLGVVVALVVGIAVVYQVLASDVASLLPEYATLKAMGYSNGFLARVVLGQAIALAILGFVPGALIAIMLYRLTAWLAGIPIEMTVYNFALVLSLSVGMCTLSGIGVVRKVFGADPADLF